MEGSNRRGMGSLGSLFLGIAIGAISVILYKRENREKIKQKYDELHEKGARIARNIRNRGMRMEGRMRREMEDEEE